LTKCIIQTETIDSKFEWSKNFSKIIKVLDEFDYKVIITSPGHEKDSQKQMKFIKKIINGKKNYCFIKSLGVKNYFEKLKESAFVIGNSSSGVIEVPYFRIPTINIGKRQNGRFFHDSIIECDCNSYKMKESIKLATSNKFKSRLKKMKLYFGNGGAGKKILKIMSHNFKNKHKLISKKFISKQNIK